MAETASKTLSIDLLVLDGGTQSRVAISEETVADYAEALDGVRKWPFLPLNVFHDGSQYLVSDGFHRTLAARRAGRASIPCIIHQGTAQDALRAGMKANSKHGLRRSQADKKYCVDLLIDGDEKLTQQQIADIADVSRSTVTRIVADRRSGQADKNASLTHSERANDSSDDDPFDVDEDTDDPFGEGEEGGTDAGGQDGQSSRLPGSTETSGESSQKAPDPAALFKTQRSKTVKTAEALGRAFGDLNDLRSRKSDYAKAKEACRLVIELAKNW